MNWKKRFVSQKLNVKFTLVIILFMVIPISILAGILFYNMEKNVVSENTGYMEYTMERNKDAVATKINSINMSAFGNAQKNEGRGDFFGGGMGQL